MKISYQKLHQLLFPNRSINYRSTQSAVHQLSFQCKIDFAASKSTQTTVLYLFYVERLFMNLLLIHFHGIVICMRTHTCDHHMVVPENSHNNQLLSPFLFVFVNKPVHQTNETTNLHARFFYNTVL